MEIEVKGHSGCSVSIVNNHGIAVQKSTHDKGYIHRLKMQGEKQKKAFSKEYQHIRIPEIYEMHETGSSYEILMEYVYSKNFIDFFEMAGFEQIDYFIKAIRLFLNSEIQESHLQGVPKTIVEEKLNSIRKNIEAGDIEGFDDHIAKVQQTLNLAPDILLLPVGVCHGDLTFSNILFNGNNYYLIDFLDSFIESPLMDMVKLRQDSAYFWSLLMYSGQYDDIRVRMIFSYIDQALNGSFSEYDWYQSYYKLFQQINFLRVAQYAKEQRVIEYLKNVLNNI